MDRLPVNSFRTRPFELRGFADELTADPADEADGGWLLSFVDILTLLLTLFVLLLAISHTQRHDPAATTRVIHRPVPARADPAPAFAPTPRSVVSGPTAAPAAEPSATAPKRRPAVTPATPTSAPLHASSPSPSMVPPQGPPEPAPAQTATATPAPAPKAVAQPHPGLAKQASPAFVLPKNLSGQVQVIASANRVNLVIKDDVLFAPGNASLQPAGREVLARVARLLIQDHAEIAVEGYTDNTPIHTARFPSNWELSTARATAVTRFLIAQGIASNRLSAIGYGATRPRASNATAAGRALNRRVSLVLHLNKNARVPTGRTPTKKNR